MLNALDVDDFLWNILSFYFVFINLNDIFKTFQINQIHEFFTELVFENIYDDKYRSTSGAIGSASDF